MQQFQKLRGYTNLKVSFQKSEKWQMRWEGYIKAFLLHCFFFSFKLSAQPYRVEGSGTIYSTI